MVSLRHLETGFEIDSNFISINEQKTESIIDLIIKSNVLPFQNKTIFYNDDLWDFTTVTSLNIQKKDFKFNFARINQVFRNELKKYVVVKIIENKMKISSIRRVSDYLCSYFKFLYDNHIYSIQESNSEMIEKFLSERKNVSNNQFFSCKFALNNFYKYYAVNYSELMSSNIEILLESRETQLYTAHKKQNKISDIDNNYFERLIQGLLKILDDTSEAEHIRAIGCVLLILSQTGLRISEVLALEIGSIETIYVFNNIESNYLIYKTWKRVKGENRFVYEKTFVNELAKKAYLLLEKLHHERRTKIDVPFLYVGSRHLYSHDSYPVDANTFLKHQAMVYYSLDKYLPTVDVDIDARANLQTIKFTNTLKAMCNDINSVANFITYPKTQQFRVKVCTDLYHKGVPLQYIQKFMGHLSYEMQGYYVRPKSQTQENIEFSKRTLKNILSGDLILLGSNSSDILNNIQEFIRENNFNVQKDLETIVDSLMKKIPIRQKMGGVCIKSSMLRDCSIDAKTNEFYCAYGVCTNIFHFFYNIDISYRKARELSESITINLKNGYTRQVEKEKNMLKLVLRKQFEPELKELKSVLAKRSINDIYIDYPNIKEIVENLNSIELEAATWMKLTTE